MSLQRCAHSAPRLSCFTHCTLHVRNCWYPSHVGRLGSLGYNWRTVRYGGVKLVALANDSPAQQKGRQCRVVKLSPEGSPVSLRWPRRSFATAQVFALSFSLQAPTRKRRANPFASYSIFATSPNQVTQSHSLLIGSPLCSHTASAASYAHQAVPLCVFPGIAQNLHRTANSHQSAI